MADSSLNIGITLTGASQAAAATSTLSQGMGAVVVQVNKLNQATTQLNQTQSQTASAMKQTQTATGNAAMSLLFLSQAIEDAQYGFSAVLNNIPLIIMGMGYSAGVAGAVSIAGVAVNVLTKNLDLLGTTSHDAAVKASEAAASLRDTAAASQKAVDATDAQEKALRDLGEQLDAINKKYDESIEKIDKLAKATIRKSELEQGIYDADYDLAFAQIELRKEQGQISESQATQETAALKVSLMERKKQLEVTKAETSASAELAKMKEAEAAASAAASISGDLTSKMGGLLSPEQRTALERKRSAAFSSKNAAAGEMSDLNNPGLASRAMDAINVATLDIVSTGPGSDEYLRVQREYIDKRKQSLMRQWEVADMEMKGATARLENDKKAQSALGGISDPAKVNEKIEAAKKQQEEAEKQRVSSEENIKRIKEESEINQRVFDARKAVVSTTAATEAIRNQKKSEEDIQKAKEKERQIAEDSARAAEAIHNSDVSILGYARGLNRSDGEGGGFRGKSKGRLSGGSKGVDPRLARLSSMVEAMGADGYTSAESDRILKEIENALKGWASKSNDAEIKLARLGEMIRDHSSRLDKTRN